MPTIDELRALLADAVKAAVRSLREEEWDDERTIGRAAEVRTGTATGGTSKRLSRRQLEARAERQVTTLEQKLKRSNSRK